jgi:hypothetical protein
MIKMPHVFVSHASADKHITKTICDALAAEGVSTWVSFRDIPSGANWDESIEAAITAAIAVVVVVSPASVRSRCVRDEVEEGIRLHKTVIPTIIRPAQIPFRWRTLQHVKWNSASVTASIRQITRGLPHATATRLREALDDPCRFDDVRALILKHTEWLPLEFHMAPVYTFKTDAPILGASRVDCFAGRLDSIGPRAHLYYLGSPYRAPIYRSGALSPQLRQLLGIIRLHRLLLGTDMRETHKLAPKKLFQAELRRWNRAFSCYTFLKIHLIVGRRNHYEGASGAARERIAAKINEELFPRKPSYGGEFEIMSYDRILDMIPK